MAKFIRLMGCVPASLLGDAITSPATGFAAVGEWFMGFLNHLITNIWELVVKIVMLIAKFLLVFIDFIFAFIREVVGMNESFDRLSGDLENSDLFFRFLQTDSVRGTIRAIFAVSII